MRTYAQFRFHEANTRFVVQVGEVRNITLNTANGPATVEIGLKEIPRSEQGVHSHLTPYFRNLGGGMFTNYGGSETDQVIHPKDVVVVFEDVGTAKAPGYHRFNRRNKALGAATVGDKLYGLRDAWMKEPTALYAGNFAGSTTDDIAIYCLEDRGPYPPFPAIWRRGIDPQDPHPGEDPMSVYAHRLRGGMANMWNVLVVDADKPHLMTSVPAPKVIPTEEKWANIKNLSGVSNEVDRTPRPVRFQKIIDSMRRAEIIDTPGQPHRRSYPWIWYFFRGTDRFLNWASSDGIFDVSDEAQNIGWKNFGDIFWAEGHYNLGYDWLLIAARMWLDKPDDQMWWDTMMRFAEWQCQQGTCWSGRFRGMQWYEKGSRGGEVGSYKPPSPVKQRAEGLLLVGEIFKAAYGGHPWWYAECIDVFRTSQKAVNAELYNGAYGQRHAGWRIMNSACFYRYEKDNDFRNIAINQCLNFIDITKLRTHVADKLPEKWKDPRLGIPFCPNNRSTPRNYASTWGTAKVARGMVETLAYCDVSQEDTELIHDKILQMSDFLAGVCTDSETIPGIVLPWDSITADLTPAWYRGHYIRFNMPRGIEGHLPWYLVPVGYAALNGVESCKRIYSDAVHTAYSYPEPSVSWLIEEKHWEGFQQPLEKVDERVFVLRHGGLNGASGVATDDVTSDRHMIRLRSMDGRESQHTIISTSEDTVTLSDDETVLVGDPVGAVYDWIITGPLNEDRNIRGMDDKAVKHHVSLNYDLSQWAEADFNWNDSSHVNTWFKNMAMMLSQWDHPMVLEKMIADKEAAATSAEG